MSLLRIIVVAALAASFAASAAAAAGTRAARVVGDPYLGRISGGAAVDFRLDRRARSVRVTIAGRSAALRTLSAGRRPSYRAVAGGLRVRAGRRYTVRIVTRSSSGGTRVYRERLRLHRSLNRASDSRRR